MILLNVLTCLALAGPSGVLGAGDTALLTDASNARALPAAGLKAGRVGGLPAVRVEVLYDRVLVDGKSAMLLSNGQIADNAEYFARPFYERLSTVLADRQDKGADAPFVAVAVVDGRVDMGTLDRLLYTAEIAGVDQVAFLVNDRSVRDAWRPTAAPAPNPGEMTGLSGLSVSAEGFELRGVDPKDRVFRGVPSLGCEDCKTVDDLPWDALDKVLARLAKANNASPKLELDIAESDVASHAMVRGLDALQVLGRPVVLSNLAIKPLGGGLLATGDPAALPWGGRLEVVSARLPEQKEKTAFSAIPLREIERVFTEARGRTDACLALAGGSPGVSAIRVEIDQNGSVAGVSVADDSFARPGIGPCLSKVVRELKFPAHTAPDVVVVMRRFAVAAD